MDVGGDSRNGSETDPVTDRHRPWPRCHEDARSIAAGSVAECHAEPSAVIRPDAPGDEPAPARLPFDRDVSAAFAIDDGALLGRDSTRCTEMPFES